jgi:hypothetical protein
MGKRGLADFIRERRLFCGPVPERRSEAVYGKAVITDSGTGITDTGYILLGTTGRTSFLDTTQYLDHGIAAQALPDVMPRENVIVEPWQARKDFERP